MLLWFEVNRFVWCLAQHSLVMMADHEELAQLGTQCGKTMQIFQSAPSSRETDPFGGVLVQVGFGGSSITRCDSGHPRQVIGQHR